VQNEEAEEECETVGEDDNHELTADDGGDLELATFYASTEMEDQESGNDGDYQEVFIKSEPMTPTPSMDASQINNTLGSSSLSVIQKNELPKIGRKSRQQSATNSRGSECHTGKSHHRSEDKPITYSNVNEDYGGNEQQHQHLSSIERLENALVKSTQMHLETIERLTELQAASQKQLVDAQRDLLGFVAEREKEREEREAKMTKRIEDMFTACVGKLLAKNDSSNNTKLSHLELKRKMIEDCFKDSKRKRNNEDGDDNDCQSQRMSSAKHGSICFQCPGCETNVTVKWDQPDKVTVGSCRNANNEAQ